MRRELLRLGTAMLSVLAGCAVAADTGLAMRYGVFDTDVDVDTDADWCELSGHVTDAHGEQALEGIQVAAPGMADRTNDQGGFTMGADGPCPEPTILLARDVDGPSGGTWADTEVEVDVDRGGPVQGAWDIHIQMEPGG